jgi:hypothetical protein
LSRSRKLEQLRPVTFHLKTDPNGVAQYGLIAEEVDKVYPELVIRDADGKIQGVRYEELAPMLLNELQKQAAEIEDLKAQVTEQVQRAQSTQQQLSELNDLKQELRATLLALQGNGRGGRAALTLECLCRRAASAIVRQCCWAFAATPRVAERRILAPS